MTEAMMKAIHARTKRDRKHRVLRKVKALSAFQQGGVRHLDTKGREARAKYEAHEKAIYESKLVKLHHRGEFWHSEKEDLELQNEMNEEERARTHTESNTAATLIALGLNPDDVITNTQKVPEDRSLAMAFLKLHPLRLSAANAPLRCDKEVVLAAVNVDWRAIAFCSEELKNDLEIVEIAVSSNWRALQFAGSDACNNLSIMMLAVQQDGEALKHGTERIENVLFFY